MQCSKSSSKFQWIAIIIGILTAISVSVEAKTFSFSVEKKGKGSPIILIPGITCDGNVWSETVEVLSKNYECHILTLPGFAGQETIDLSQGYLNRVENEVIEYLRKKRLNKPIVIGHSLGGYLALSIGSHEPKLISKMIIVDALPFFGAAQNPAATEESMKPIAQNMMAMWDTISPELYQQQQKMMLYTMISAPEKIELAFKWGKSSDRATVSQAMYELYTTDLRDDIAEIEAPTLVLGSWIGYKDYGVTKEMIQRSFDYQYSRLDKVEIKISDTGKHFIMWDDFDFYIDEIEQFLNANPIEG